MVSNVYLGGGTQAVVLDAYCNRYRILHNNKFLFLSMSRVHTCNEFKILKITKNVSCAIYILNIFIYFIIYVCVFLWVCSLLYFLIFILMYA